MFRRRHSIRRYAAEPETHVLILTNYESDDPEYGDSNWQMFNLIIEDFDRAYEDDLIRLCLRNLTGKAFASQPLGITYVGNDVIIIGGYQEDIRDDFKSIGRKQIEAGREVVGELEKIYPTEFRISTKETKNKVSYGFNSKVDNFRGIKS